MRIIRESEMQQAQKRSEKSSMAILAARGPTCSVSGIAAESVSEFLPAPVDLK
jgi:hypothetical protein